jgi:hypothetical protein
LLSARQIAPGETGQIEVKVNTGGLSGSLTKYIGVTSNDPRQPEITLQVTAVVQPEFRLSEPGIFFGGVPRGREVTKELTIAIAPERRIKILHAESTDRNVMVRLVPVPGSNEKRVRLVVIQKPDSPEGYHFGTIVVKTTSALTPELRIPVRGLVNSPDRR